MVRAKNRKLCKNFQIFKCNQNGEKNIECVMISLEVTAISRGWGVGWSLKINFAY